MTFNALNRLSAAGLALALAVGCGPVAAGGLLGLDHRINRADAGLWSPGKQSVLKYGAALVTVGGALWEGRDTRLGRTFFKATDAMVMADAAALLGKVALRRQRPVDGNDPGAWGRQGGRSFPSGEVTHITAVVTPFIAEFHEDHPAVWALAALPLYSGVARLKNQAHWQTDVLAGMALGAAVGLYAHGRDEAWSVKLLPHGFSVGLSRRF
ncbi:MAG: phosphatase PAP2 family protein [Ramlibacter sp.]|nr:phosphatase PAP2 family protein [Ramlibacter sp.]